MRVPSDRIRISLVIAICLRLPAATFAVENTFDRTLSVNGPVTLYVSTGSGYLHVSAGSDNQVHLVGHVKAANNNWFGGNSTDDVSKVIAQPPINQAGNIIRIGGRWNGDILRHVSIDYEITTPRNTLLDVESGSGDIQLAGLTGTIKAGTGSGDIRVDGLGSGSKLETGSGSIEAHDLAGASILQTGSGKINAQFSAPGDVSAGTGSGSVHLVNVQGALRVKTGSGDVEVSGKPTSSWKLETGSGSITIIVGNAHFMLDAQTGSGSVKSDLPVSMQGSMNQHHVKGTVNGGGPTIQAETGSGDIRIH